MKEILFTEAMPFTFTQFPRYISAVAEVKDGCVHQMIRINKTQLVPQPLHNERQRRNMRNADRTAAAYGRRSRQSVPRYASSVSSVTFNKRISRSFYMTSHIA